MDIISLIQLAIDAGMFAVEELLEDTPKGDRTKISVSLNSFLSGKKNPIMTVVNISNCPVSIFLPSLIQVNGNVYPADFIKYMKIDEITLKDVTKADTLDKGEFVHFIFDRSNLPESLDLSSVKACGITISGIYYSDISFKLSCAFFYNKWIRKAKKFFIRK